MKILNFGSCNIDYVYKLDHIVCVGETEQSQSLSVFPGGKGLNQSISLARAGAEVYHAGCIGSDGELLLETLTQSGVDLRYIKHVPEKNGHAIIQVSEKGENSIFLYAGSNAMITEEFVDEVIGAFDEGDFIVLQNEINNMDYIIRSAHQKGMKIVLNPSPINENIDKLDFNIEKNKATKYDSNFINTYLTQYLIKLGFFPKHMGFYYIKQCIEEALLNNGVLGPLSSEIYPSVARKYGTNAINIERNIRNSIECANKYNDGKEKPLTDIYHNQKRVSNRAFLAYLLDQVIICYEQMKENCTTTYN